jgi:hypothetical protein
MKNIILVILMLISPYAMACIFGDNSSCGQNEQCVFIESNKPPRCHPKFMGILPNVLFPYGHSTPITCWKAQGKLEDSSHAWINSLYAIDLHGPKGQLGQIHAGLDGKVIAFGGCRNNSPMCNSAFGNQIKILSKDGIMLYYVHLSEIYVKTGEFVRAGQIIGREGATGNVGGMWGEENDFHHLHMSVHSDWRNYSQEFHHNTWPGIDSIPFKFILGNNQLRDIRDIECSKFSSQPEQLFGPRY